MPDVRPLPILGIAFALGLLFNYFLFGKIPGLGYTLFVVAIVIGAATVSWIAQKPLSRPAWWYALLSVVFAAGVSLRASDELTFMNVVLSISLLLLAVSESIGNRVRMFSLERYVQLARLPLYFLGNIGRFFSTWLKRRNGEHHSTSKAVIRGVLLSLPLLVLFVVLFSSADFVFHRYVKDIVDINISPETLIRTLLVIAVTCVFIGAFWFVCTSLRRQGGSSQVSAKPSAIGRIETLILLGSINVLFLLFIIVQLAYLFGGQNNIAHQGFTYAEYARRGFFELIVVAVISWLVVWTLDKALANNHEGTRRVARLMSLVLAAQVFVIMASAFMRLVLYEQAYGFTTQRFYSHAFVVWLAVVFVLLLYKLFVSRREDALAFSMLVSVLVFAGAVNVFNPDAFIAKQNMSRYAETGKIDIFYLDQLSPDSVPAIMPILDAKNPATAKATANRLYWKQYHMEQSKSGWQSYNISRRTARRLLDSKRGLLEENKDFSISSEMFQVSAILAD